jgi:hypothetical protein
MRVEISATVKSMDATGKADVLAVGRRRNDPAYRDIAPLFAQARERLNPGGVMFLLISSDSDLALLAGLIGQACLRARAIEKRSLLIEQLLIYELRPR